MTGATVPARPPEVSTKDLPILDYAAESKALRDETRAVLAVLDATPPGRPISHFVSTGWGLLRTGLLAATGALLTAVGGLLAKSYAELIVRNLARFSVLHQALAATADPDDKPPDA